MAFTLQLQQLMVNDNYLIAIRDNFENILIKSVLKITTHKIEKEEIEEHIKKRIFGVIVECLQNICKTDNEIQVVKNSILLLQKSTNGYSIIAGSPIDLKSKERLKTLMDGLSIKTYTELKEEWRSAMIDRSQFDSEKRENLALLDLHLRSNGNVKYFFDDHSENNYFFMIQIEITNK
jgi:hypothetical protein